MATLHGNDGAPKVIYINGAMEALVERCSHALGEAGDLAPLDKALVPRGPGTPLGAER